MSHVFVNVFASFIFVTFLHFTTLFERFFTSVVSTVILELMLWEVVTPPQKLVSGSTVIWTNTGELLPSLANGLFMVFCWVIIGSFVLRTSQKIKLEIRLLDLK